MNEWKTEEMFDSKRKPQLGDADYYKMQKVNTKREREKNEGNKLLILNVIV